MLYDYYFSALPQEAPIKPEGMEIFEWDTSAIGLR
jgi:hypothetical protein